MERKNITVNNTENITENERTEKREKITVKRRGRVAAAAVAAVMLVGGGGYLLGRGFDKVDDSFAKGGSSHMGLVPEDFVGWFDPEGYTVFDKFGPESDIWRLKDGRFLIRQYGNLNGVIDEEFYLGNGMECHYFIYDGSKNSVVGTELNIESWRIQVYDDCFALWDMEFGDIENTEFYEAVSCTGTVYDFDMNPIKSDIRLGSGGRQIIGLPMVTPDKEIYYASASYGSEEEGYGGELMLYDEKGNEMYENTDSANTFFGYGLSKDGGYMYHSKFCRAEYDALLIDIEPLKDGYEYGHWMMPYKGYPQFFDIGNDLYFFGSDAPFTLYKVDASVFQAFDASAAVPEAATLDNDGGRYGGHYVSESGKYLFICTNDYGDVNSCTVRVYDTENDFELIHDERVPGLNLSFGEDGQNILVDEESGDVNIGGFSDGSTEPSPRLKKSLTFNLYGDEYGNFGIGVYSEDTELTDDETAVSNSGEVIEPAYGFDPKGETIMEKFGSAAEIWKLTDNRYVAEHYITEDGKDVYEYSIYDVPSNTVVNRIVTEKNMLIALDNGFAAVSRIEKLNTTQSIEATVYNTDGNEVYTFSFDTGFDNINQGGISQSSLAFSPDGAAMYVAVRENTDGSSYTSKLYRVTPNELSIVYGCINGDGWENRDIFDMAVSGDGNILAYVYSDDGKSIKLGLMDSGSYRVDVPPADDRVIDDAIAASEWNGHHYLFERGNDFYFISDENGELVIARATEDGYTPIEYAIPQKGSYDYYLSETGKYILLESMDKENNHIFVYEITDGGLTLVKDIEIGTYSAPLYPDCMNTFFDEVSGDLCLPLYNLEDMEVQYLKTNVFGGEYGNFNWNTAVSREGDYPPEEKTTVSTTVTADIPDIDYGDDVKSEMTLTVEGDMVYIVSDSALVEEVKQWYRDFLKAGYEPAQYPDTFTEMAYEPRQIHFYDDNGEPVVIETPENTIFDVRVNGVDYNGIEMKVISNLWWNTF